MVRHHGMLLFQSWFVPQIQISAHPNTTHALACMQPSTRPSFHPNTTLARANAQRKHGRGRECDAELTSVKSSMFAGLMSIILNVTSLISKFHRFTRIRQDSVSGGIFCSTQFQFFSEVGWRKEKFGIGWGKRSRLSTAFLIQTLGIQVPTQTQPHKRWKSWLVLFCMITLITVLASRFRKEVGVINLMFDHEITLGAGAEFTSELIKSTFLI